MNAKKGEIPVTIGENIQKHRKELGLSQEELGKKLLLSRQTISLWEKNQTVPTIDNLIRLKEIFGISIDEILGFEDTTLVEENTPNESYRQNFSVDELNAIRRLQNNINLKNQVISLALAGLLIIMSVGAADNGIMMAFSVGTFLTSLIVLLKGFYSFNNAWRNVLRQMSETTYEYSVFDEYVVITLYRSNEKIRMSKYYFSDIEKISQTDKWLFLTVSGQTYIIRKEGLKDNSALYLHMYTNPVKVIENKPIDIWRILSVVLFVASFFTISFALALSVSMSSENDSAVLNNMWVFFLFLPIPISSVIVGFILKSKGYKYKKNIIIGFIFTFLLCIYGSFSFIF